jgi:hypothetical protein
MRTTVLHPLVLAGASLIALPASAAVQVVSNGFGYSQNFDSLATTGTANAWANDVTLTGWHLFRQPAPGTAISAYGADTGGSNAGNFWSYGTTGSGERALGGLGSGGAYFGSPASGAVAGWIAASFDNASGQTLNQFSVGFDGEQWRNGGNTTAQTMVFEYGFGSSFGAVGIWTAPGGLFDWASPVNTATAAAVVGNVAGLAAGRGGAISGLSWNPGDRLWLRWTERNDAGNDHGLAIDHFSFSASGAAVDPVPLPAAGWLLLTGVAGLFGVARRRARAGGAST